MIQEKSIAFLVDKEFEGYRRTLEVKRTILESKETGLLWKLSNV